MRYSFQSVFILVIFCAIACIASCNKVCDEGYDGKRCDVEIRDRYEGTWNALDEPGNKVYVANITKGSGILDLVISNGFSDSVFTRPIKASAASDAIHIALYKPDTGKIWVEGTGLIEEGYNKINWTYNIINRYDTPEVVTSYTGVWTK